MLALVDYDTGNVRNVQKALSFLGIASTLTADPDELLAADGIILPGVGAFQKAMAALADRQLVPVLQQAARSGQPMLGICLGMQLLFDYSDEFGRCPGLGILPGAVVPIPKADDLKVPHMGWDKNVSQRPGKLADIFGGQYTYFVHSFYVQTASRNVVCSCDYGVRIPSVVRQNNVIGMQFHPEKSGKVGLAGLSAFEEVCRNADVARN
ncbi:imidazole glycerol phosphate synthase subunit HisH [Lacticaseibacillus zhaodongensis]|uniref:imidazole glycerol phosphate synthase subunit HisH n=1 Tax=Lacticaseibacillus zhaodongensis TaxID=2668065 RepID=UPI0012D2CE73|nr:imidazole glycerol phosphate synthase subunit HisH [Lacticaseibacillus zhaodongensis]